MLELKVKMININLPMGHRVLRECTPMYEYAWFIEQVRRYQGEGTTRDKAVVLAIKDSIREGIFADFVRKHGTEVENMLFTQFNMDDALEVRYEEGLEDGIERGMERGMERGLQRGLAQGMEHGRAEGEQRHLIRQVCGKLQKNESPEKIAEDLLADREEIGQICAAYEACGPEETAIYHRLKEKLC